MYLYLGYAMSYLIYPRMSLQDVFREVCKNVIGSDRPAGVDNSDLNNPSQGGDGLSSSESDHQLCDSSYTVCNGEPICHVSSLNIEDCKEDCPHNNCCLSEETIRERAYYIWKDGGNPDSVSNWFQAIREIVTGEK